MDKNIIIKKNKGKILTYKITSITADGAPRTDGRYPLRVGCTGELTHLNVGDCMIFEYAEDSEGNEKYGLLRTSTVLDIKHEARHIVVTTLNSVYTLVVIGEEEK